MKIVEFFSYGVTNFNEKIANVNQFFLRNSLIRGRCASFRNDRKRWTALSITLTGSNTVLITFIIIVSKSWSNIVRFLKDF